MIAELALLTLATAVPVVSRKEETIVLRNGQSAVLSKVSKPEFEDWCANPTLTSIKPSKINQTEEIEDIFVSPIKSSIKVRMKVRISGKVSPIPVDSEDIVYLDE
jgi:hypothetical protein